MYEQSISINSQDELRELFGVIDTKLIIFANLVSQCIY